MPIKSMNSPALQLNSFNYIVFLLIIKINRELGKVSDGFLQIPNAFSVFC